MILVDFMGHMVSTKSKEELDKFAIEELGMKESWYQETATTLKHPHYDLTTQAMINKALRLGAEHVTPQGLVRRAWWNKKAPA